MPVNFADGSSARPPLRRLGLKLVLLVFGKVLFLVLIWWIAIRPHPRPDTSPAGVERQLAPTDDPSTQKGRP